MSPNGIFVGLSLDELQAELAIARERVRFGDRVALSGAGKSSSRNFSLSAQAHAQEAQYAIAQLTGTAVSRTYFDARNRCSA